MSEQETLVNDILGILKEFGKKRSQDERIDLFHGEMAIMFCLFKEHNENADISPSMLSDMLNITRPSVTSALNSLEEKGYIIRTMSRDDRRKMSVEITDKGKNIIYMKDQKIRNLVNYLVEELGNNDATELVKLLKKSGSIINNYNQMQKEKV